MITYCSLVSDHRDNTIFRYLLNVYTDFNSLCLDPTVKHLIVTVAISVSSNTMPALLVQV